MSQNISFSQLTFHTSNVKMPEDIIKSDALIPEKSWLYSIAYYSLPNAIARHIIFNSHIPGIKKKTITTVYGSSTDNFAYSRNPLPLSLVYTYITTNVPQFCPFFITVIYPYTKVKGWNTLKQKPPLNIGSILEGECWEIKIMLWYYVNTMSK